MGLFLFLWVVLSSGDSGLDWWACHLAHLLLIGVSCAVVVSPVLPVGVGPSSEGLEGAVGHVSVLLALLDLRLVLVASSWL